jgi:hypothetical protein
MSVKERREVVSFFCHRARLILWRKLVIAGCLPRVVSRLRSQVVCFVFDKSGQILVEETLFGTSIGRGKGAALRVPSPSRQAVVGGSVRISRVGCVVVVRLKAFVVRTK